MPPSDAVTGRSVPCLRVGYDGGRAALSRAVPEEVPVALVHDGTTHAVMLATPADLEDFAVGFALTEGVIAAPDELGEIEVAHHAEGIELRAWLAPAAGRRHRARRRALVGPTGCGLCGVDSLGAAVPPPPEVGPGITVEPGEIRAALRAMRRSQALGTATRATHAAGAWTRAAGLVAVREDVGRHNALDKLAGCLARGRLGTPDMVLITSRVSVEMVQKTAALGAPVLVAVSAPTSLAIATAEAAGITLAAVARDDGFEIFTHDWRVVAGNSEGASRDVA
jgi:FdhD protein